MIALHKSERATYRQAVEAQVEYAEVHCYADPPKADCDYAGPFCCCC